MFSSFCCFADEKQESRMLLNNLSSWFLSYNLGWDDSPYPLSDSDSSTYGKVKIGSSYSKTTGVSFFSANGSLGNTHYFDVGSNRKEQFTQINGNFSLRHSLSDVIEVSTRNYVTRELEPDYEAGIATVRESGDYVRWNTSNSLKYSLSQRLSASLGFSYTDMSYRERESGDFSRWGLSTDLNYRFSPQASLGLIAGFKQVDKDDASTGSGVQSYNVGANWKYRFDEVTALEISASSLFRELEDHDKDSTDFHANASLRYSPNDRFSTRLWLRYSPEDNSRRIEGSVYDDHLLLRLGVNNSYQVSEKLSLRLNLYYIDGVYEEKRSGEGKDEVNEGLLHVSLGASFKYNKNCSVTATYNYSDNSSDYQSREYERQRFHLGVRFNY